MYHGLSFRQASLGRSLPMLLAYPAIRLCQISAAMAVPLMAAYLLLFSFEICKEGSEKVKVCVLIYGTVR